ncbi:MAG: DoxX family protein [Verrucomicrobiaceae bacterium]|nr:MAG: DoxX family protein [Verrucomicrobiaceae bacterium]
MNTRTFIPLAGKAYGKFSSAADHLRSPLLLAIRLYWGWQFCQAGWGKLHNLSGTTGFFTGLGIPFPAANAVLASTTECFGGLLILIGVASRLTAIPLIVTMVVAYLTADMDAVKGIFTDPDTFVTAAPFLFLLAPLVILAFGPGKISVDHLLARRCRAVD